MKGVPPTASLTFPVPVDLEPNCFLCMREMTDPTDPRVMDCFHVFCIECIVHCRVVASTYECMRCNECTFVPFDDPKSNLPVEFGLANFIELKRFKEGSAHCVVCSAGQSTSMETYCVVCEGFLCQNCTKGHFYTKCAGHYYLIEDYFRHNLCKLKQLVCSTHGSFTSYFCDSCNTPKCPNCLPDDCQPATHRYKLENVCEEMRAAVKSSQMKIREAASKRKDIEAQLSRLEQEYQTSLQAIDAITKYTIEHGEEQADRLKKDVEIAYVSQEVNKLLLCSFIYFHQIK